MIPAVIWFLQVAWYCLSIFFRSICSFPAKRFGTMSCFYSLGSISALCVTVFIMYFLSHRMQQAAQNFDSAAVPPPIPCPGNPQQAGLYNYPAYRTRSHKNDPSLPQKDALLLMLLVNQASHRQCSRKKHRLIDTVTSCHSKPPKKKRRTSRTGLLPSEDSSDKEDKLPSTSIPPGETTRHQLLNGSQMFCRVPRPCYLRAALAQRIANSPRYGFQRSLVFASGFVCFVRFVSFRFWEARCKLRLWHYSNGFC